MNKLLDIKETNFHDYTEKHIVYKARNFEIPEVKMLKFPRSHSTSEASTQIGLIFQTDGPVKEHRFLFDRSDLLVLANSILYNLEPTVQHQILKTLRAIEENLEDR